MRAVRGGEHTFKDRQTRSRRNLLAHKRTPTQTRGKINSLSQQPPLTAMHPSLYRLSCHVKKLQVRRINTLYRGTERKTAKVKTLPTADVSFQSKCCSKCNHISPKYAKEVRINFLFLSTFNSPSGPGAITEEEVEVFQRALPIKP